MSEPETKTIEGVCAEISERGDWTTFHVDIGTQYPVKLSTKLDSLIELGRAASKDGGRFAWTFKESQGGENPHKPGTYYTNRYLSGVEPASNGSVPDSPQTSGSKADVDWDAKERRDYRSRAWAQTISALTHTIKTEESTGDIYRRLYALQRMIYRDIVRDLDPDTFPDDDVPFD